MDAAGTATIWITGRAFDAAGLTERLKLEVEVWDRWIPNPNDQNSRDSTLEVLIRCDQHALAGAMHDIYKACDEAHIFNGMLEFALGLSPFLFFQARRPDGLNRWPHQQMRAEFFEFFQVAGVDQAVVETVICESFGRGTMLHDGVCNCSGCIG